MDISFYELKLNSRKRILSKGSRIILVSALLFALLYILDYLSMNISGYSQYLDAYSRAMVEYMRTGLTDALERLSLPVIRPSAIVLVVGIAIMQSFLNIGYIGYCLAQSRNVNSGFKDIFDSFSFFFRVIAITLLLGLIILLYTILAIAIIIATVIFGLSVSTWLSVLLITAAMIYAVFIAVRISLQYGLVYYVMFDEPEMSALQCLRQAKELTKGRLMQYFALQLSFFGWYLLNAVISTFLLPVVAIWLNPYQGIAIANYYNKLTGRYVQAEPVSTEDPFDD